MTELDAVELNGKLALATAVTG